MFAGPDNNILEHINPILKDLFKAINSCTNNPIHCDERIYFVYDISNLIVTCDGSPRNKITGIKGGGHVMRYGYNMQTAKFTATVLVQNETFLIQLGDYYTEYTKQLNENKNKKESEIDSMCCIDISNKNRLNALSNIFLYRIQRIIWTRTIMLSFTRYYAKGKRNKNWCRNFPCFCSNHRNNIKNFTINNQ